MWFWELPKHIKSVKAETDGILFQKKKKKTIPFSNRVFRLSKQTLNGKYGQCSEQNENWGRFLLRLIDLMSKTLDFTSIVTGFLHSKKLTSVNLKLILDKISSSRSSAANRFFLLMPISSRLELLSLNLALIEAKLFINETLIRACGFELKSVKRET